MRKFFAGLALGALAFVPAAHALDTNSSNYSVYTNTFVPAVASQTSTNYQIYAAVEPIVGEAQSPNYVNQSGVPIPPDAVVPPSPTPTPTPSPTPGIGDLGASGDRQNSVPPARIKEKPTLEFTYPTFLSVKKLVGNYPMGADRILVNGSTDGVTLKENNRWEKELPLFLGFNHIVVEAGFGSNLSEPVVADLERLLVGDSNRSWSVDDTDLSLDIRAFGIEPLVSMGDYDDSGKVEERDISLQFAMWGTNLKNVPPTMPSGGSTSVLLQAPAHAKIGETFDVAVRLEHATDIDTLRLNGSYDNGRLKLVAMKPVGPLDQRSPNPVPALIKPAFSLGSYSIHNRVNGTATVAILTFEAVAAGRAEVHLDPSSRVLASALDQSRTEAQVFIDISGEVVNVLPENPVPGRTYLAIFSTTHPDPNRWYQPRALDLQWKTLGSKIKRVYVSVDPNPAGQARAQVDPEAVYRTNVEAPGLWYGHARVEFEDGTVKLATLRYEIDDTPPHAFVVLPQQDQVSSDIPNAVRFGTIDDVSGIAGYAVLVDDVLVATTTEPYAMLGRLAVGNRRVEVKAYDEAGNVTAADTKVTIVGPGGLTGPGSPLVHARNYILYAYGLAAGLLAFLLAWLLRNLRRLKHKH